MGRPRKVPPPPATSSASSSARPNVNTVLGLLRKGTPVSSTPSNTIGSPMLSATMVRLKVPPMPVSGDTLITNLQYTSDLQDPQPINLTSNSGLEFAPLARRNGNGPSGSTVHFKGEDNDVDQPSTSMSLLKYRLSIEGKDPHVYTELTDFENSYPSKTSVCCWWCAYPFDDRPIGIPVVFNDKTNAYYCKGCFCSFSCALAYVHMKRLSSTLLRQMYYQFTCGADHPLTPAPDPSLLDIFGGRLNIEQFRMKGASKSVFRSYEYPQIPWPCYKEENIKEQHNFAKTPLTFTSLSSHGTKL